MRNSKARKQGQPAEKLPGALGQILDSLLKLDIPAQGRIAHHIRTGRLHQAVALIGQGQTALWKRVWLHHAVPGILEQLRLLRQVERLLIRESRNMSTNSRTLA